MVSQAALYIQAIAMLREREAIVTGRLRLYPMDRALRLERVEIWQSLRLFRRRLRRTESMTVARYES